MNETPMEDLVTLKSFLKSISSLVTDDAVRYVFSKRRIAQDLPLCDVSDKDAELAEATMYYWLSNLPVGGGTEKVSDGGWSHSEGGWTVSKANIEEWKARYRELFEKWGEKPISNSKVRIINF